MTLTDLKRLNRTNRTDHMRIGVMAAGAVGGYFGGRLAAAGHDVVFFARGAHLTALASDGLKLDSVAGHLHLPKVVATDDPASAAPVDVVLFAVKLWDTEKAGALVKPVVGPDTRVITVQNGVDSVERLTPILGRNVVGGVAQISAAIAAPGVIGHTSSFAILRFGRSGGATDPHLAAFAEAGKAAGLDLIVSPDIDADLWKKFVFLVGLANMTAALRLPAGAFRSDPDIRAFHLATMREVVAVAKAKGVGLEDGFAEDRLAFVDSIPAGMRASMAVDLERGNRLELDWLAGKVVTLGRELGVPVPANEAVYAMLKPYRLGRPGT
jgi:2-dehydropantoate 2-reductase